MKTVLCFGDSNTWGWKPETKTRYGLNERWTGVMRNILGNEFWVVEEGLSGRTLASEDSVEEARNGKKFLKASLLTHYPIDLVIIMLGTNDIKKKFSLSNLDIARDLESLIKIIVKGEFGPDNRVPKILIICPPPIKEVGELAEVYEGGEEKSKKLPGYFSKVAEVYGCEFLNAGDYISTSDIDGIHLEVSEHKELGKIAAEKARVIFMK